MHKKIVFGCFLASSHLFALQEAPWLGNPYEFVFHTDFIYSQYSKIDQAIEQPNYAYNNYVNDAGLSLTMGQNIDFEWEINFARTPHQTYGFRSTALQARYLLLDDIAGDLLSFIAGLNTRAVTGRSVKDVSSPYASYWNGELTISLGKEFTKKADWITRGYLMGSVGIANHGSLWDRCSAVFEAHFTDSQALKAFAEGYFGYGGKTRVNIDHFKGWGYIAHRSLDIGASYRYFFSFWGDLELSYKCRVIAKSYPQREQTILFAYNLPFSFF